MFFNCAYNYLSAIEGIISGSVCFPAIFAAIVRLNAFDKTTWLVES
jgi:hypothetical protein